MDMQSVKVDTVKVEGGDWVGEKYGTPIQDMGDLCLKVRGMNCAAWRALSRKLAAAVPRNKKVGGVIAQDEQDKIINACLLNVGVMDWDGMTDGGKSLPYSKDVASQYLTDPAFLAFRDAALWACSIVGAQVAAAVEDDVKN